MDKKRAQASAKSLRWLASQFEAEKKEKNTLEHAIYHYAAAGADTIDALLAEQERENQKPCDTCEDGVVKLKIKSAIDAVEEIFEGGFPFCPVCGRKLEQEDNQ